VGCAGSGRDHPDHQTLTTNNAWSAVERIQGMIPEIGSRLGYFIQQLQRIAPPP
jgi:hypothetical protein